MYARPLEIRVHQKVNPEQLASTLTSIGYRRQGQNSAHFWFEASTERLHLGQLEGKDSATYQIDFRGNEVRAIVRNGNPVTSFKSRDRFLSSLFDTSREKRKHVALDQFPQHVLDAVLAAEDKDFFDHPGVSATGFMRAVYINLVNWGRNQGGSTLTQQFIKNYFLTPDKQFKRKFEEIIFAVLLERRLTKKQILELYANEVYLGQLGSFAILGLGQGSAAFFGKNVQELTLGEAATLAGIIQAPNRYSPHRNLDEAVKRRNFVLDQMERESFITTRENALARRVELAVPPASNYNYSEAPYFIDHVHSVLRSDYDLSEASVRHLTIHSTLDPDLQRAAFESIQSGLKGIDQLVSAREKKPKAQAALVAVDPKTGEVLALVGGRDYASSQYNRATVALRPPGSSFKPFVYAAALQGSQNQKGPNLTLSSHFIDEPHTFRFEGKTYAPKNFGGRYYGIVTARQALARSLNVPTVSLAEQIGFDAVVRQAGAFGFNRGLRPYPSIALGTFEVTLLELVQAYQGLANQGQFQPLKTIRAVVTEGGAVRPARQTKAHRALPPEVAFLVTSALQSVLDAGTARGARTKGFQLPAAGKTGSTDDSWFVGYTPDLLCGVWVGTDQAPPLDLTGAEAALPIWTDFMLEAERIGHLSGREFSKPAGIVTVRIDPASGLLASESCQGAYTEYFVSGSEPKEHCKNHQPTPPGSSPGKKKGRWNWLKKIF